MFIHLIIKMTGIFRLAKSSIASSNDNLILNLIFMAGLVILLLTLNQRFYFVLIMSTLKNVIRKSSFNHSYSVVLVWY